jgi:phosphatidylglycerol---prolipoprotein diacylglyceryl transferase
MNAPAGAVLGRWAGRRFLMSWRGVDVPSYTAMLYLGCVMGVLVGAAVAGSAGLDPSVVALSTVVLLIPALAGSRLWFVLEHWSVYRQEPRRIWRRSEGGSALHGGLLLSLVVSVPLLALLRIPFWTYWDAASFTMLLGLVFTRIGCVMHGCCAGRATSGRLGVWLPDHCGVWQRRIPTQLLEAAWAAAVLAGASLAYAARPSAGATFFGALAAYAAGRLLLEPTRETAGSGGSRANMALSALLMAGASIALVVGWGG